MKECLDITWTAILKLLSFPNTTVPYAIILVSVKNSSTWKHVKTGNFQCLL